MEMFRLLLEEYIHLAKCVASTFVRSSRTRVGRPENSGGLGRVKVSVELRFEGAKLGVERGLAGPVIRGVCPDASVGGDGVFAITFVPLNRVFDQLEADMSLRCTSRDLRSSCTRGPRITS